ncbi:MAG: hypothetical protein FWC21_07255, partial [Treponema sp.]|nr:hypothetical protein [Treponema sp.]
MKNSNGFLFLAVKRNLSAVSGIRHFLFTISFLFLVSLMAVFAHAPGEGGSIEKTVTIAQWRVNPDEVGVNRIGADNHVLRLGLNITAEGLEAIQAGEAVTLNIPYVV